MEQHAQGKYPIEQLIAHYDVEKFQEAIDDTKSGKALKAVLNWNS